MEHEVFIPVPAETLREALRDHARVARCVPGLQQDADESARPLSGRLKVRVGGHTITYRGALTLTERAGGFTAKGEGAEVRGTGSAKVNVRVRLTETADGTKVTFTATATSEGRLSELDATTTEATARRLLDRFTTALPTTSGAGPDAPGAGGDGEALPGAADEEPSRAADPSPGAGAGHDEDAPTSAAAGAGPDASGIGAGSGGRDDQDVAAASGAGDRPDVSGVGDGGEGEQDVAASAGAGDGPDASGVGSGEGGEGDQDVAAAGDAGDRPGVPGRGDDQDVAAAGGGGGSFEDGGARSWDVEGGDEVDDPFGIPESERFGDTASGDGDFLVPLDPPAEAAHARRTMIGRSAEEVDHAPPRGRYAPEQAPDSGGAGAALRWVAPAAALAIAGAVVVGRALRRRR
ncbi:SRPBCC domain-containing protein [Streptomyces sp. NPDC058653]|uniref:SRPBCC domain-containing protein n=1 Tax=Streptomyces sp. NPDC058653 TaxID=3346576 RepID=UPI0036469ED3